MGASSSDEEEMQLCCSICKSPVKQRTYFHHWWQCLIQHEPEDSPAKLPPRVISVKRPRQEDEALGQGGEPQHFLADDTEFTEVEAFTAVGQNGGVEWSNKK